MLYHFTNISNLESIAEYDQFECSEDDGKSKVKGYCVSTARNGSWKTGYVTDLIDQSSVARIALDGEKLSYHYKIRPIDYYIGSKNSAIKSYASKYVDWDHDKKQLMKQSYVETEDRVYTGRDPFIPSFHSYILNVEFNKRPSKTVIDYLNKFNIPYSVIG